MYGGQDGETVMVTGFNSRHPLPGMVRFGFVLTGIKLVVPGKIDRQLPDGINSITTPANFVIPILPKQHCPNYSILGKKLSWNLFNFGQEDGNIDCHCLINNIQVNVKIIMN